MSVCCGLVLRACFALRWLQRADRSQAFAFLAARYRHVRGVPRIEVRRAAGAYDYRLARGTTCADARWYDGIATFGSRRAEAERMPNGPLEGRSVEDVRQ